MEAAKYNFVEELYSSLPPGWEEFFNAKEIRSLLLRLESLIHKDEGYRIVPLPENVFNAFYCVAPEDIKVILLGQDPYHNLNADGNPAAMGMSFSCWDDAPIQPSLKVMFKEMMMYYDSRDEKYIPPENGNLMYLSSQGVFLLNAAFTTRVGLPKSHQKMWEGFSRFLIEWLYARNKKIIFLLLGREAQKFCESCKSSANFVKVEAGHPSPLNTGKFPFLGSGVFKKVNDILEKEERGRIEWLENYEK